MGPNRPVSELRNETLGRNVDVVEDRALHHLLRDRIRPFAEVVPL